MSLDHQLAEFFAAAHGAAAARSLASMDAAAAAEFIDSVNDEAASSLLAHMTPPYAATCIARLDADRAARLLESLGLQRCVLIARRLDRESLPAMMSRLPKDFAAKIERRLRYPAGTAGWLADSTARPLPHDIQAAEAVKRGLDPRFPYVYLVDPDQKLVGAVHVNDILTGPNRETLKSMSRPTPIRVSARTPIAELERHRAWKHLDVLPVVDSRGAFVGALRHKALRQLQSAPPARGTTDTSFLSMLELAEMYWLGLSSVFLPVPRTSVGIDQEPPHEH